ncbi:MAG: hypothetical protein PHG16_06860 [Lachnospiraceae bacterium]|nr:hypothetical protein [Lachnospiraceae bacterium]
MKKKPNNLLLLIIVLALSGLMACQNPDSSNDSINHNISKEAAVHSSSNTEKIKTKLSSGVSVNADIKIPEGAVLESMPTYFASLQELPFEKIENLFIKNTNIINKIEQPSEDHSGNGVYKYYQMEDGSTLAYGGGVFLHYSSARYSNIQVDFEIENNEQDRFRKDFDFETRKSADDKIRKILCDLGMKIFKEDKSYALDYKWLQEKNQMEEQPDIAGKIENNKEEILWNDELNCYLFQYFGCIDDMPITDQMREEKGILIPAPKIYVVYSKNGIEQIEVSNCFQIESEGDKTHVYDADAILSVLDEKYNSIIMEGNYSVEKLQLEYVPIETDNVNEYKLIPAWRVFITHELTMQSKENSSESEMVDVPTQVLFNAIDGKEIQTGVGM